MAEITPTNSKATPSYLQPATKPSTRVANPNRATLSKLAPRDGLDISHRAQKSPAAKTEAPQSRVAAAYAKNGPVKYIQNRNLKNINNKDQIGLKSRDIVKRTESPVERSSRPARLKMGSFGPVRGIYNRSLKNVHSQDQIGLETKDIVKRTESPLERTSRPTRAKTGSFGPVRHLHNRDLKSVTDDSQKGIKARDIPAETRKGSFSSKIG